jgi:hypothetical protein
MRTQTYRAADGTLTTTMFDMTWDQIRRLRQTLLDETDWRAVSDRVLPDAWQEYRQALRDLPQDYESANDAADNFPQRPE